MTQVLPDPKSERHWLTGSAVWTITVASAALNAWMWTETAAGVVVGLLVTVAIAAEILGVRLALRVEEAASHRRWARFGVALALLIGVIGWNAYSGKRALALAEAQRLAPVVAAAAAHAEADAALKAVEAEIARIPALRSDVPAQRLAALQAARDAELARLEPRRAVAQARRDALPPIPAAAPAIPPEAFLALVLLIEAVKALALWAVAAPPKRQDAAAVPPGTVVEPENPAKALARKRWGVKAEVPA